MASKSQMVTSPSISTGTWPLGEPAARASAAVCSVLSRIRVSVNGSPVCFSTSHGLSDQEDQSLSPISNSMTRSYSGKCAAAIGRGGRVRSSPAHIGNASDEPNGRPWWKMADAAIAETPTMKSEDQARRTVREDVVS